MKCFVCHLSQKYNNSSNLLIVSSSNFGIILLWNLLKHHTNAHSNYETSYYNNTIEFNYKALYYNKIIKFDHKLFSYMMWSNLLMKYSTIWSNLPWNTIPKILLIKTKEYGYKTLLKNDIFIVDLKVTIEQSTVTK